MTKKNRLHIIRITLAHNRPRNAGARAHFGGSAPNLVDVHVRLRAGARLEDDEREVVVQFAGDDLKPHMSLPA